MKRFTVAVLIMILVIISTVPAHSMYSPPSMVTPTKEDLQVGETFFKNIKWNLKDVKNNKISLYIPALKSNYIVVVNVGYYDEINNGVGGSGLHQGNGGVTLRADIKPEYVMGFTFLLVNDDGGAIIAKELYTYRKAESAVKYVPPSERRFPYLNEKGEIKYWIDDLGNRYNADGTPYDPKNPQPAVKILFKDIPVTFWGFKDINKLAESGFIKGYTDGKFRPNNKITRAEFMTILDNILKAKWEDGNSYTHDNEVSILNSSHWSFGTVNHAFNYMADGDIDRIFANNFKPDKAITREEVVAVLTSVLSIHPNFKSPSGVQGVIKDTSLSKFPESIKFSLQYNLVTGYPDQTFKPKNTITRAEVSAVMVRLLDKI